MTESEREAAYEPAAHESRRPSLREMPLWVPLEWAAFYFLVGLIAGATLLDALLYGAGIGFLIGLMNRREVFAVIWDVITLRCWHLWRHPIK